MLRRQRKSVIGDVMVGWYHQLNGHELGQTLGADEGHRSLACCSPLGHGVGHDLETEQQQRLVIQQ